MKENNRIAFWDIFKGILIFLVVFTHFLYNYTELGYAKYIVNVIYFFHMPAFIFISGYFSKKEISYKKALKYILLYLIFNTVFILYTAVTSHTLLAITPFFSYWYLLALVAWRIIAKYLPCNKWYIVIPACFVISLLSGYFSDITNVLAIQKILGFLPFFFIGYYLPENFIISFTKKRKPWVYILAFVIFVLTLGSAFFISRSLNIQSYLLMENYFSSKDILIRILVYAIAFIASFSLLCMIPNTEKHTKVLQKWGKNSIWIYLFHRPITLIFAKVFFLPSYLYVPASLLATLLVCAIFSFDKLNNFLNTYTDKAVNLIAKRT